MICPINSRMCGWRCQTPCTKPGLPDEQKYRRPDTPEEIARAWNAPPQSENEERPT